VVILFEARTAGNLTVPKTILFHVNKISIKLHNFCLERGVVDGYKTQQGTTTADTQAEGSLGKNNPTEIHLRTSESKCTENLYTFT